MDWADTLRNFGRHCGMTAKEVLEGQSFGQLVAVWFKAPAHSTGLDMGSLRDQINRRRAALGKPPMKPQPKD